LAVSCGRVEYGAERAAAERHHGLSAWCRIYSQPDPRSDKRAGHRMAGGDAYPCADKPACDGRASGDGNSDHKEGKQLQPSHEFHLT